MLTFIRLNFLLNNKSTVDLYNINYKSNNRIMHTFTNVQLKINVS